jgi:hypothetical protein
MIINEYKNLDGLDCVVVDNQDGTFWSGLKSVYDEQQARQLGGN